MSVESAVYIADLNAANPTGSDAPPTLGTHIRLLKSVLVASFPNVSGAVTPTHTELNYTDGVSSNIQTQLDAKFDWIVDSGVGGGATLSRARFQLFIFTSASSYVVLPASPQTGDVVIAAGESANVVRTNTGQTWQGAFLFGNQIPIDAMRPVLITAASSSRWIVSNSGT